MGVVSYTSSREACSKVQRRIDNTTMAQILNMSNSDTALNCASENSECRLILSHSSSDAFSDTGDGMESLEVLSETLEPYNVPV